MRTKLDWRQHPFADCQLPGAQCIKRGRQGGLRFWAEYDEHGVASGHGSRYPKHYAIPLTRARESLRESLQRVRSENVLKYGFTAV